MKDQWVYVVYAVNKDGTRSAMCAYTTREMATRHVNAVSREALHMLGIAHLAVYSIGLHVKFPQELLPSEASELT